MIKKIIIFLVLAGLFIPSISFGAVAFNATGSAGMTLTPHTLTATSTISGSNLLLTGSLLYYGASAAVSSCKWNGTETMTLGVHQLDGNYNLDTYYLANPTAGTHNTTCTFSSNPTDYAGLVTNSWTGASATGQPNATSTNTLTDASQSITTNVTTTVANAMILDMFDDSVGAANCSAISAGTGQTQTNCLNGSVAFPLATSYKLATSTGSYSMTYTDTGISGSIRKSHQIFAIAPAATTPTQSGTQVIWW